MTMYKIINPLSILGGRETQLACSCKLVVHMLVAFLTSALLNSGLDAAELSVSGALLAPPQLVHMLVAY